MTPSRSMANSAARTSTRGGPSPAAAGKRKTPRSSRLYQRHQPSSYQARILSRSPLRLRKTNQCPDRGSSPRAWRTSALSPSNDLRRSAGSAHRKMRMAGDRLSMTVPPARAGARGGRPGRSPAGGEGTARGRGRVQGAAFGRGIVPDVDRQEGHRVGSLGLRRQAAALLEPSSPGVEGRDGEAVVFAEGADRQSAASPALDQPSPMLFLAGIAGLAGWHGKTS